MTRLTYDEINHIISFFKKNKWQTCGWFEEDITAMGKGIGPEMELDFLGGMMGLLGGTGGGTPRPSDDVTFFGVVG